MDEQGRPTNTVEACECPSQCNAKVPHRPGKCRRKQKWFMHFHAVDECRTSPPREVNICGQCFDAHVGTAKRVIAGGMEGLRALMCMDCHAPITRLSSIIRDVARV